MVLYSTWEGMRCFKIFVELVIARQSFHDLPKRLLSNTRRQKRGHKYLLDIEDFLDLELTIYIFLVILTILYFYLQSLM